MPLAAIKDQENKSESTLVKAAKAIGKAAGTVASLAGVQAETAALGASKEKGKLSKKNKHRLPRREKKAQRKTMGRHGSSHDSVNRSAHRAGKNDSQGGV